MEEIEVYDGLRGFAAIRIERASAHPAVRFFMDPDQSSVWHIDDPKSAKKLRKLLKPLADLA